MKRADLIFTATLLPVDYTAVLLAGTVAFNLRHQELFTSFKPVTISWPFASFFQVLLLVALGFILLLALNGLYSFSKRSLAKDLAGIISACSTATLIIMVAFFFDNNLFNSRLIVLLFLVLSIIFISLARIIFRWLRIILATNGYFLDKVLVVGQDATTLAIVQGWSSNFSAGYKVVANLPDFSLQAEEQADQILATVGLDQLVIADNSLSQVDLERAVNYCHEHNLVYKYSAGLLKVDLTNFDFSTIAGLPFIEVKRTKLDGWGRVYKRTFDLLMALLSLVIIIPLGLIIALIIKLDSPGPIFVKLTRIGKQNKPFGLYKFRSMIANAQQLKAQLLPLNERQDGPLFKLATDPRITRFGHFLRRFSLDELPQVINIIKGEMSLVGPRPHEPEEVKQYAGRQKQLLAMRPGLTGLAQVSGRSDLLFAEEVRLDLYYIEHWHPTLDLVIIFKTPRAVFQRRQAA